MTPRLLSRTGTAAVAFALSAGLVLAQPTDVQTGGFRTDSDAPVEVEADNLALDQTAGTAVFSGGVVITQGEMRLTAPEIVVNYLRNPDGSLSADIETITATGGVMVVTPTEAAEARDAVYSPTANEVVMTGDVVLTQGPNTLAGEKLTVDLETGTGRVEGRVRTILQPGSEEQ